MGHQLSHELIPARHQQWDGVLQGKKEINRDQGMSDPCSAQCLHAYRPILQLLRLMLRDFFGAVTHLSAAFD